MSYYQPDLGVKVYNRIIADTGTNGLYQTGSPLIVETKVGRLASGFTYPCLQIFFPGDTHRDAFRTTVAEVLIQIHAWALEEPDSTTLNDSTGIMERIIGRLRGDWEEQSSRIPSYGLHRWVPTLSSGWSSTHFLMRGYTRADEPGLLHAIVDFTTLVSRDGA